MKKHPEQKESEKFLGNFTETDFYKIGWKTKRMGKVAYYANMSGPIPYNYELKFYPVFVQLSEVEKE